MGAGRTCGERDPLRQSGAGVYNINNEQQIVSENQCFLVPRGVTTFWQADGIKPWDYWWICFLGEDVPELLESCGFDGQHYVLTLEDATPIWIASIRFSPMPTGPQEAA